MQNYNPKIVDRFGRVHDYLRISLTERCNLRCFYCMPEEGIALRDKAEFMTAEELISIATTFVNLGVKKIRLTGGEPLVKKGFDLIVKELSKLPIELAITTNGILLDRYFDTLKEAKIKNINVSLDSLKEERFNAISRRNYFQRIKNNIQLLQGNAFNLKINVVLMKGVNDDEIIDFIDWSIREQISIRFIEFMPFDGNNWNTDKKISHNEVLSLITQHYGEENIIQLKGSKNDTATNYKVKDTLGSFGLISSISNPFCDSCNRIRLTADGKIKNCLFSQTETDLLAALRNNEDIIPLITSSITSKHKERGGIKEFNNQTIQQHKNRAMVSIGG